VQVLEVDVIGSSWCTLASLRDEPGLSEVGKYPDALLREVRDEWEAHIEDLCRTRWVPGYGVQRGRGTGRTRLAIAQHDLNSLRLVTLAGVDVTDDCTLEPATGLLELTTGFTLGEAIEVHYEYGTTRPPQRLLRELRKAVRSEVMSRGAKAPTNAISETSPDGGVSIRYSTPDPSARRWTGILTLDPAIERYRRPALGIA
jgi:hypothetical protein